VPCHTADSAGGAHFPDYWDSCRAGCPSGASHQYSGGNPNLVFIANSDQAHGAAPAGPSRLQQLKTLDPGDYSRTMVPDVILQPPVDNNVIQLIVITCLWDCAACSKSTADCRGKAWITCQFSKLSRLLFEAVIRILKWVIALVPLAVFGIVVRTVAHGLRWAIQSPRSVNHCSVSAVFNAWHYLIRQFGSVSCYASSGGFDALLTAFSPLPRRRRCQLPFRLCRKIGLLGILRFPRGTSRQLQQWRHGSCEARWLPYLLPKRWAESFLHSSCPWSLLCLLL